MNCASKEEEIYTPIPYSLEIPVLFADKLIAPIIPADNPLTQEGVALGKKLFFDTILSGDETQSCASCHDPKKSFTDQQRFSNGVNDNLGTRNAMPLFNLAWNFDERFAWDGKEFSLEKQALEPVTNPIEMHGNWENITKKLQNNLEYKDLFLRAFGTSIIDSTLVTKAIAQFERTLISGNSKFDKYLRGEINLTPEEQNGFDVFMDESKGDCFHCHGSDNNPIWSDNKFHNNGLDNVFVDLGLGKITGDPKDNGKFKSPSIRNLAFTAPYMHDGRFATLEEVINHYSEGLKRSPTIDPLMKKVDEGGVHLSTQDKSNLKAFLQTLSDYNFIKNPTFQR
ncbi:MAG: cytochrome c peroxidase [Polaribacter sp.]|uniref:cytochrome-c peroxidase n=1 Tax=Polaribacter sp. TaxID=1920175 RepID=UPI00263505F8|nr:cytochrome c peroxidase [Polaribacter sp.]MBT3740913.1 cytochrome-c peroxidase [Polaribacter sp.]MDG1194782.1 cytochrome c peroxidase [Polaribacter sp.]MDG1403974.1 cytochrome c peroxidase [Polaribacter sp.]MDG2435493.1 cytochrome c peroxidase [Polaribacter sp.]